MADSDQSPTETSPLDNNTAEIFRQAMARSAQIHQGSIDEMHRQTDEMHNHLRAVTHQRVQAMQIPNFQLVMRANVLEPSFWDETVTRAVNVLQQHGEYPAETEHINGQEETPSE